MNTSLDLAKKIKADRTAARFIKTSEFVVAKRAHFIFTVMKNCVVGRLHGRFRNEDVKGREKENVLLPGYVVPRKFLGALGEGE